MVKLDLDDLDEERMAKKVELLAPGGDLDSIRAAIAAGADAIYCGLSKFNARHRAANIKLEDLGGILYQAHKHHCRVYLTLNTMMVETDIPVLVKILNALVNTSIDGVIVQDIGLLHLLAESYSSLEAHASTQLTTHNSGQLSFLKALSASRVNLSRELSLQELQPLIEFAHQEAISTEVFVHGSFCLSFSGICYMSSVHGRNSANRGACSQPCRAHYPRTPAGHEHPLNLKDNSAFSLLPQLLDAGADALKIEGRMKHFNYVYTVTKAYREQLDRLSRGDAPLEDDSALYKVFNREFSSPFLKKELSQEAFSPHPRNRAAAQQHPEQRREARHNPEALGKAYDRLDEHKAQISKEISAISLRRPPLTLRFSGQAHTPLQIQIDTPDTSFTLSSKIPLTPRNRRSAPSLTADLLLDKLKALNHTDYFIAELDLQGLESQLFLPQGELARIREALIFKLTGKPASKPCSAPKIHRPRPELETSSLSVLIDTPADLELGQCQGIELHYQIPSALVSQEQKLIELLNQHRRLIPYFPAILLGEEYRGALNLLHQTRPQALVTDNSGIAFEAQRAGIEWIAGPALNIANSLALRALKTRFACAGAFLSNELSRYQLGRVKAPDQFKLYYSIYHPITLLTSRLCLFPQVTGCSKARTEMCLIDCERRATITNQRGERLHLHKRKGNFCQLFHSERALNTQVVVDFPSRFSCFGIDLRDVGTQSQFPCSKRALVHLFQSYIAGEADAEELQKRLSPSTSALYEKGV